MQKKIEYLKDYVVVTFYDFDLENNQKFSKSISITNKYLSMNGDCLEKIIQDQEKIFACEVIDSKFNKLSLEDKIKFAKKNKEFFCPHCKTTDKTHIKNRIAYVRSFSDDGSREFYFCTNCENEFTTGDLRWEKDKIDRENEDIEKRIREGKFILPK